MDGAWLVRFARKIYVHQDGCWLWSGTITSRGYGQFVRGGRREPAHRVAYEVAVGPIPDGMQLDHLCRERSCVNPTHLEPVTCRENLLRGETLAAKNVAKTTCPSGHTYDRREGNRRRCSKCINEKNARYRSAARSRKEGNHVEKGQQGR